MDYEQLLRKYILHVSHHEGSDFTSDHTRAEAEEVEAGALGVLFTDEEWGELQRLANEEHEKHKDEFTW